MEFRLTYEGKLLSHRETGDSEKREARALHKHEIRRRFRLQLKCLWENNHTLKSLAESRIDGTGQPTRYLEWAAQNYERHGFRWVPLVTQRMSLICKIDVLMLRCGLPGDALGDIDNRLKTIFDALKMPDDHPNALGGAVPQIGEDPFFVLLEDDRLITHVSVETDTLLEPVKNDASDARLVLTVRVLPYRSGIGNLDFVA